MTLERLLQLQGRLSRRDFLARMVVATGVGLIGCTNDGTDPDPDPGPEVGNLDNIIVVTMENRSFHHLLGWLPTGGWKTGGSFIPRQRRGIAADASSQRARTDAARPIRIIPSKADHAHSTMARVTDGSKPTEAILSAIGYYQSADLPFLRTGGPAMDSARPILRTNPRSNVSKSHHLAGRHRLIGSPRLRYRTPPTIWDRLSSRGSERGKLRIRYRCNRYRSGDSSMPRSE